MKPTFRHVANRDELQYVGQYLTGPDADEVMAMTGLPGNIVVPELIGPNTYVGGLAEQPDNPMLAYGCEAVPGTAGMVGQVWLLVTPDVYDHPVELVTNLKKVWAELHEQYPILMNWADARNERHLRLLKWLGCRFFDPIPLGPFNRPFIEFTSVRPCV